MIIKENTIRIKIEEKINKISNENLIEIFCTILAFNELEKEKGNDYNKVWLNIKYKKEMIISEYINIFKIIRTPFIYEFIKYFKNIDEKFNKQNIETKLDINEYLEEIEEISQEIIIIMIFKIETNEEDLIKKKNNLIKLFKFSYTDKMFENMK
jgi:hypothetical protein